MSEDENIEKWIAEKINIIFYLNKFKEVLLAHLKLEDTELYPILLNSKNKKIKETANKFSDEMVLISKKVISFFDTYSHLEVEDLSQNENFRLDLIPWL